MRKQSLPFLLLAILASGLIAAGCGDDESTSGETAASEAATAAEQASTGSAEQAGPGSGTVDAVYEACLDVAEGTPGGQAATSSCEMARDAFEQCVSAAESTPDDAAREDALAICEQAATEALDQFEAAG